ncbi:MAG: DUF721 domain-containing protein [Prevotella sp.]|nr:DUF721 domain-containing protein [Prevotella sp.]
MFRKKAERLDTLIQQVLRQQGLETPLQQKRLIDAWPVVVGTTVERYTAERYIKNQTLHVKITNPALRQDLSMMRSQLVSRLNQSVGTFVISDIRIY